MRSKINKGDGGKVLINRSFKCNYIERHVEEEVFVCLFVCFLACFHIFCLLSCSSPEFFKEETLFCLFFLLELKYRKDTLQDYHKRFVVNYVICCNTLETQSNKDKPNHNGNAWIPEIHFSPNNLVHCTSTYTSEARNPTVYISIQLDLLLLPLLIKEKHNIYQSISKNKSFLN